MFADIVVAYIVSADTQAARIEPADSRIRVETVDIEGMSVDIGDKFVDIGAGAYYTRLVFAVAHMSGAAAERFGLNRLFAPAPARFGFVFARFDP